ncbi:uncharacterized protein LOC143185302 [Calliopsis andreniformis]|uniref:uncharacterized protein LOC143185302 n=1 Tax=Calliopsis andreniformis TaxID=337506 RepID=UPI003FCE6F12
MFIYLVAVVATLFLIFGLLHARCLNDWLRSSVCCSLSLYNGLIRRPAIETSLNSDLENVVTESPPIAANERTEHGEHPTPRATFNNKERLSDAILGEAGSKARSLNPPRYSFENILSEDRDKAFGLPATRPLELGTPENDTIRATKQEGQENIFESLKSSIERSSTSPYSRLNTSQIYNLILKEKLKENAAKQKLLETDKDKIDESLANKTPENVPSSSENTFQ